VTVTVHGRPSAVLVALEDLEQLEETLVILRDADTMVVLPHRTPSWREASPSQPRSSAKPFGDAPPAGLRRWLRAWRRTCIRSHGTSSDAPRSAVVPRLGIYTA
jgi:antitoxin (DNA-binding transcriptional repressor) of toxin-antitoxin stability system